MTIEDLKIDAGILANWLTQKIPVTILDVRPKSEREEWSIPGSIHTDIYDKLKANDPDAFDGVTLNRDVPVVTVCAAGKTSLKAAGMLKQKGFNAYSLDGGIKAWNFAWNIAEVTLHDVKIIQVRRSAKGCLSYIIGSQDEAVVIDASLDPQVYLDLAKENGWTIKYVTDTHIHADYLSRTRDLGKASIATHVLIDMAAVEYSYSQIKSGDQLKFGNAILEVIHTPGHTMESTSFLLADDAVFTGDTLFVDGVGRPDLKAVHDEAIKRSNLLYQSLHMLMNLKVNTLVLPAHSARAVSFDGKLVGESIENLRHKLSVLRLTENKFVDYILSHIPPTPPNFLTIAGLNKQGSFKGYNPADLEAGANRCAIG
jgi:glyoxylase-like metal-dependent hydrolase (beta-lactamase superfamily II)/rhodanese-related sulfurtransferase